MAADQVRQKIRAPWQRVDFPHTQLTWEAVQLATANGPLL